MLATLLLVDLIHAATVRLGGGGHKEYLSTQILMRLFVNRA